MINRRIASRYATALFRYSAEKKITENVVSSLEYIVQLSKESKEFSLFLQNRSLVASERVIILNELFEGRLSKDVMQFLLFLNEKGRLSCLVDIALIFLEKVLESKGIVKGTLISSSTLNNDLVDKLIVALSKKYNKKITLTLGVDESLIGGFKLSLGDKLCDYSITSQLKLVEKELSEISYKI